MCVGLGEAVLVGADGAASVRVRVAVGVGVGVVIGPGACGASGIVEVAVGMASVGMAGA